eukprot:COSAG06_NODE_376_length_16647_cov_19.266920_9_plen_352_part_00
MQAMKRKQEQLEQQLAQVSQDDTDDEVGVGGGSMQAKASTVAKAKVGQSRSSAGVKSEEDAITELQQQFEELRSEVTRQHGHLHELREHSGLQLTLRQAVQKIRDFLGIVGDTKKRHVVSEAIRQLALEYLEGASMRDKVQHICRELDIDTGWDDPLDQATPAHLRAAQDQIDAVAGLWLAEAKGQSESESDPEIERFCLDAQLVHINPMVLSVSGLSGHSTGEDEFTMSGKLAEISPGKWEIKLNQVYSDDPDAPTLWVAEFARDQDRTSMENGRWEVPPDAGGFFTAAKAARDDSSADSGAQLGRSLSSTLRDAARQRDSTRKQYEKDRASLLGAAAGDQWSDDEEDIC